MSAMIPNHCIPFDEDCNICNPPLTPNPDDAPAPLPVREPAAPVATDAAQPLHNDANNSTDSTNG